MAFKLKSATNLNFNRRLGDQIDPFDTHKYPLKEGSDALSMICSLVAKLTYPPERDGPPSLKILQRRQGSSETMRIEFCDVSSLAYHLFSEILRQFCD